MSLMSATFVLDADDEKRRKHLQILMNEVWRKILPGPCPKVVCYGSRYYNLATSTSDWDFALLLSPEAQGYDSMLRCTLRQVLCNSELATWSTCREQKHKDTLTWKFTNDTVPTSLHISEASSMKMQLSASSFLFHFYRCKLDFREPVMTVATYLRSENLWLLTAL